MDESTTKELADILSGIQDERRMEQFMSHPKTTDSYKDFLSYYHSLPSVQALSDTELIDRS